MAPSMYCCAHPNVRLPRRVARGTMRSCGPTSQKGDAVSKNPKPVAAEPAAREDHVSRARLIELLNEDLAREYQAIIAYVV